MLAAEQMDTDEEVDAAYDEEEGQSEDGNQETASDDDIAVGLANGQLSGGMGQQPADLDPSITLGSGMLDMEVSVCLSALEPCGAGHLLLDFPLRSTSSYPRQGTAMMVMHAWRKL